MRLSEEVHSKLTILAVREWDSFQVILRLLGRIGRRSQTEKTERSGNMSKQIVWVALLMVMSLLVAGRVEVKAAVEETIATMDEVVVTATRAEEAKKNVSSQIIVLGSDEIQQSGAEDLGQLLAEKGIGTVKQYPGASTVIGMRGFRTDSHGNDLRGHVLILLDGRRAGTGNAAKIMTNNIERIEIIRGPGSVQYGSAAMGGVINVITKRGSTEPTFSIDGMAGSYGVWEGSAGFAGKFNKIDASGSVGASSSDDYETGSGVTYYNSGFDRKNNYSLNLGVEVVPDQRLGVLLTGFDAKQVGNPSYLSRNDLDDYSDKSHSTIDLTYKGNSSDSRLGWQLRWFTGEDKDVWSDPSASDPDIFYDNDIPSTRTTDQQGAQLQFDVDFGNHRLTGGYDWTEYEITASWTPQETEYVNNGFFLLGKTFMSDQRLVLSGGLRYDTYDVKVLSPAGNTVDDTNLGLQAGAVWIADEHLRFRVNYGEAFVMPGADQLAADYITWGTHYVGNQALRPEESKTYEAGVEYSTKSGSVELGYFFTDFDNKIEAVSTAGGDRTWENLGSATISGFEGEISYDIGMALDFSFEVRPFVRFVYLTQFEDEQTDQDLLDTSDLVMSYGVSINDYEGLVGRLNVSHYGEQLIEDWETGGFPPAKINKDSFSVVDLTLSKEVGKWNGTALEVRAEGRNLLDEDYGFIKGYPMPGRSFFWGLTYRWGGVGD